MTNETEIKDSAGQAQAGNGAAEAGEAAAEEARELTPEEQLAEMETQLGEVKNQLLRALAEAENTRKRAQREVSDARAFAIEGFARDLLSVSDNLQRALEALSEPDRAALSEAGKGLLGGIEMTQKEFHTVLSRHGVVPIDAAPGAPFDPNLHQAVSQVPNPQPAGTIADVFQPGWKIGDRTLRAAMVVVSTGPGEGAAPEGGEG